MSLKRKSVCTPAGIVAHAATWQEIAEIIELATGKRYVPADLQKLGHEEPSAFVFDADFFPREPTTEISQEERG